MDLDVKVTHALDVRAQQKIKNFLITHAHLDHVVGWATMADNLFGQCKTTIQETNRQGPYENQRLPFEDP